MSTGIGTGTGTGTGTGIAEIHNNGTGTGITQHPKTGTGTVPVPPKNVVPLYTDTYFIEQNYSFPIFVQYLAPNM